MLNSYKRSKATELQIPFKRTHSLCVVVVVVVMLLKALWGQKLQISVERKKEDDEEEKNYYLCIRM